MWVGGFINSLFIEYCLVRQSKFNIEKKVKLWVVFGHCVQRRLLCVIGAGGASITHESGTCIGA